MYVWFYQDLSADIVNISLSPDKGAYAKNVRNQILAKG